MAIGMKVMMKKNQYKIYSLLLVFVVTLCVLGKFSSMDQLNHMRVDKQENVSEGVYQSVLTLNLGEVEARDYQRMGSIRAFVKFSPDETVLAVGSELGELIVIGTDKSEIIWRNKIGIGKITAVEFSSDGRFLYVGESSPEGNLYCLNTKTGEKVWQCSMKNEVGVNIKQKSLPAIVKIVAVQDKVYALALRYERQQNGQITYYSKIFCLNKAGEKIWLFPAKENLDAWVSWFSVDQVGEQLVFGTANFSEGVYHYNKNMYMLDGETGLERWNIEIPPLANAKKTVMRGSPNISSDGQIIVAIASDGRGFAYDKQGNQLWQRTISQPKRMNDVYLNSVGRDAYSVGDYVVFGTLNTYNSANWQLPTPVEHPSNNNIVVFDRSGKFISRYQAGGSVEELAFAYPYVAAAIGRNTKTKDANVHGLYIYHMLHGEIVGKIPTVGPAIAAAISKTGKLAAVVEVPLKLDNGQIIGQYQLTMSKK